MAKAKTDDYDSGGDGITFPVCSTITFVLIVAVLYWGSALKSIVFLIVATSVILEDKQMYIHIRQGLKGLLVVKYHIWPPDLLKW